jgi:hypothetical protein
MPRNRAPGVREGYRRITPTAHAIQIRMDSRQAVVTRPLTMTGIPLHTNGYGGVCNAAPTGSPSSHTVSRSEFYWNPAGIQQG